MKEQFVTFEIAAALRELGFDAYCFASIDKTGIPYIPSRGGCFKNSEGPTLACPLWQQAFDFFRYVYRLEGYVRSSRVAGAYYNIVSLDPTRDEWAKSSHRSTYTQAQIACLEAMIGKVKKRVSK